MKRFRESRFELEEERIGVLNSIWNLTKVKKSEVLGDRSNFGTVRVESAESKGIREINRESLQNAVDLCQKIGVLEPLLQLLDDRISKGRGSLSRSSERRCSSSSS